MTDISSAAPSPDASADVVGFTPGPWEADLLSFGDSYPIRCPKRPNRPHTVARVLKQGSAIHSEPRANARLIAAAPELYAALERIAGPGLSGWGKDDTSTSGDGHQRCREIARAALAKAHPAGDPSTGRLDSPKSPESTQ